MNQIVVMWRRAGRFMLRAIDGYDGTLVAGCALRLAPLVFARPGELRQAQWSEFALDNAEWRLPERRKMMQSWADYLDGLQAGANVVPLKRSA